MDHGKKYTTGGRQVSPREKATTHLRGTIYESLHNLNDDIAAIRRMGVEVGIFLDDQGLLLIQYGQTQRSGS